jgi:hypothetical protein
VTKVVGVFVRFRYAASPDKTGNNLSNKVFKIENHQEHKFMREQVELDSNVDFLKEQK